MNADLSKRATVLGTREIRGGLTAVDDAPAGVIGADWSQMVSLRAADSGDAYEFEGEASVVEAPYIVYDMFGEFTETVAEGAFTRTLGEDPLVSFVYMHGLATVMAQTRGKNLSLRADPNLSVESMLTKDDWDVQRIVPKIQRGLANSMSFAFRVTKQEWDEDYTQRRILEVNLHGGDVSVITTGHGANPAAHGNTRGLDFAAVEEFLRSAELSDTERRSLHTLAVPAETTEIAGVPQTIREDMARLYALDPRRNAA